MILNWIRRNIGPLKMAMILIGLSIALSALFLAFTFLGFSGHYGVLEHLSPEKAWFYLTRHQQSRTGFTRLTIIWPLVCTGLLVMAICELIRPLRRVLTRPSSGLPFGGRMATSAIGLLGMTLLMGGAIFAFGNFLPGQSFFAGFPNQTFDRIFVHHSVVLVHHGYVHRQSINWLPVVCIAIWLWFLWRAIPLIVNDIRKHRKEQNVSDV